MLNNISQAIKYEIFLPVVISLLQSSEDYDIINYDGIIVSIQILECE